MCIQSLTYLKTLSAETRFRFGLASLVIFFALSPFRLWINSGGGYGIGVVSEMYGKYRDYMLWTNQQLYKFANDNFK
jgi:hypothetical protein